MLKYIILNLSAIDYVWHKVNFKWSKAGLHSIFFILDCLTIRG